MSAHIKTWLALGDSYTCAEGLSLYESYPYQVVQELRKQKQKWHAPEIVAKTGWTSFELAEYLIHHHFQDHYDFVSLLIGVNNHYRGLPSSEFEEELDFLVKKAIHFSGGKHSHVALITIPDWTLTPFAKNDKKFGRSEDISLFNEKVVGVAKANGAAVLDIGDAANQNLNADLLNADGLHYSANMYALWSQLIANHIMTRLA